MRSVLQWIKTLIVAALVVLLLRQCAFSIVRIPDAGMSPTCYQGDRLLINKWAYGYRLPFEGLLGYHRWSYEPVQKGEIAVFDNPRELIGTHTFIGRCVGAPGDTLFLDSLYRSFYTRYNPDKKFLYQYPHRYEALLDSLMTEQGILNSGLRRQDSLYHFRAFSRYEYYLLNQSVEDLSWLMALNKRVRNKAVFPLIIPAAGQDVQVTPHNIILLYNTLLRHEKKEVAIRQDSLFLNKKHVAKVQFSQDYYWFSTDNSINLNDSRYFGLVPASYLIGQASTVLYSIDAHHKFQSPRCFKSLQ